MSVAVQCPGCTKLLRVDDSAVGKQARCPGCGLVFMVQAAAAAPRSAPAAAPAPTAPNASGQDFFDFLDGSSPAPPVHNPAGLLPRPAGGYSPRPGGGISPRRKSGANQTLALVIAGGVALGVVALIGVGVLVSQFFGVEAQLERAAAEVNRQTPIQLDPITRLDRAVAGPGRTFTYMYTVTQSLSAAEKRTLQATVTQRAQNVAEMKKISNAGVTIWFKYYDPQGRLVLEFSVKR